MAALGGGAYAAFGGTSKPQSNSDIELQRGLVGWWKLNGNAKDSTPYGDNGVVNGATLASDREGAAKGAYAFANNTDNISIPANPVLNTSVFTYAAWVKPTSLANNATIIGSAVNGGPQLSITGASGAGTTGAPALNEQNVVGITNENQQLIPVNAWTHVVVTMDASYNTSWYINGKFVKTASNSPVTFTFSNFLIGKKASTTETFVGSISDVRIYNRALSAAEVSALAAGYNPETNAASGESGLVGWWKMDGNAKDSTPYAHDASLSSTPPIAVADRKGTPNSAYSFSGVSGGSSFNIPGAAMPTSQISFSIWVEQTSWANYYDLATLNFGTLSNATGWDISSDSTGTPKFSLKESTTSTSSGTCAAGSLTLNAWHHLVGTYDGSTVRLYLDGTLCTVAQNAYTGDPLSNTGTLVLGERGQGTTHYMDDARVYNRALSASEVSALYNSYNSQLNLNTASTNGTSGGNISQGLVGYWPLNDNAKDSTPYSNDGVVTGATYVSDRNGRANEAMLFSGSPDNVQVPYASSLNPANAITISTWFMANALPTGNTVDRFVANTQSGGYALYQSGATSGNPCGASNLCFQLDLNGTYQYVSTPRSALTQGNWYLLTATYDGTNMKLYTNSTLMATSANYSGPITGSTAPLCFGAAPSTTCDSNFLGGGALDEVRIYNRALSAAEVQTLYQANN